jgi:hypothetical protein
MGVIKKEYIIDTTEVEKKGYSKKFIELLDALGVTYKNIDGTYISAEEAFQQLSDACDKVWEDIQRKK